MKSRQHKDATLHYIVQKNSMYLACHTDLFLKPCLLPKSNLNQYDSITKRRKNKHKITEPPWNGNTVWILLIYLVCNWNLQTQTSSLLQKVYHLSHATNEMVQSQNEENIWISALLIITLTSTSSKIKLQKELAERHYWSFARPHSPQSQKRDSGQEDGLLQWNTGSTQKWKLRGKEGRMLQF